MYTCAGARRSLTYTSQQCSTRGTRVVASIVLTVRSIKQRTKATFPHTKTHGRTHARTRLIVKRRERNGFDFIRLQVVWWSLPRCCTPTGLTKIFSFHSYDPLECSCSLPVADTQNAFAVPLNFSVCCVFISRLFFLLFQCISKIHIKDCHRDFGTQAYEAHVFGWNIAHLFTYFCCESQWHNKWSELNRRLHTLFGSSEWESGFD